ncbi:MAG: hypothetical protein FWC61_00065 [Proteobacteria bacterium]|nr:hypothetical protein [Pseudomonadota bacterium]
MRILLAIISCILLAACSGGAEPVDSERPACSSDCPAPCADKLGPSGISNMPLGGPRLPSLPQRAGRF